MGRSEGFPRRWTGQVLHEETSRKTTFLKGDTKESDRSCQKEPCLTPTLMDERQAKEP